MSHHFSYSVSGNKLAAAQPAKPHVLRRTTAEHNLKALRNGTDASAGASQPQDAKAKACQATGSGGLVVKVVAPDGSTGNGGSDDEYDIKVVPASPSIAGSDVGEWKA